MSMAPDPVRIEAVRQGLAEGLSWSQIGKRLGVTKNSVNGIVRRHIYKGRNPAKAEVRKDYSRKPKAKPKPPPKPMGLPDPVPIAVVRQLLAVPPPPPVSAGCQWPTTDCRPWRFCADPAQPGLPYCTAHCRVAFPRWAA